MAKVGTPIPENTDLKRKAKKEGLKISKRKFGNTASFRRPRKKK